MYNNLRKNKGITLVALIVTIIILLILAGISIAQLTGNGLFEKAKLAKEKQENAQIKEDETLDDYENKIGEYVNGDRETITVDKEQYQQLINDVNKLKNKFYYVENIPETTITTSTNLELKRYTIPEDGIYMIELYTVWPGIKSVSAPRYNVITQLRNSSIIEQTFDGDSIYNAGDTQTTNTTTFLDCKQGDVLVFSVSQYTGANKQVSGRIKLTK